MELLDWLERHETILTALGLLSLGLFLVSLLVFPLIIIFLPHDYFVRPQSPITSLNPFRMLLRVLKNAFGCFLILAGVLMLFLPGQGLLSILLGISFIDFRGKRKLELRILRFPKIRLSVAWIRRKAKRVPILLPEN